MQSKILIFSDSHGIGRDFSETIKMLKKDITHVLFLGDGYINYTLCENTYDSIIFDCVPGNCDYNTKYPIVNRLNIGGKIILMTHGHQHNVKTTFERICSLAAENKADICLFGHTHTPTVFIHNNILFLNPGSISNSRNINVPTYGIIEITNDGKISYSLNGIFGKTHRELNGDEFVG